MHLDKIKFWQYTIHNINVCERKCLTFQTCCTAVPYNIANCHRYEQQQNKRVIVFNSHVICKMWVLQCLYILTRLRLFEVDRVRDCSNLIGGFEVVWREVVRLHRVYDQTYVAPSVFGGRRKIFLHNKNVTIINLIISSRVFSIFSAVPFSGASGEWVKHAF